MTYTIIQSKAGAFDIVDSDSYVSALSSTSIQEAITCYLNKSNPINTTHIAIKGNKVVYRGDEDFYDDYSTYGHVVATVVSLENIEQEYPELFI